MNGRPIQDSHNNNVRENEGKINMIPKSLNYDLTDADIDTTHSSRAIEYIVESIKKQSILREGEKTIDHFTTQPFRNPNSKSSSIAIMPYSSHNLNNKKPYLDSVKSPVIIRGLRNNSKHNGKLINSETINRSDSKKEKRKSRQLTQPRNFQRQYGLSGQYNNYQGTNSIPSSVSVFPSFLINFT